MAGRCLPGTDAGLRSLWRRFAGHVTVPNAKTRSLPADSRFVRAAIAGGWTVYACKAQPPQTRTCAMHAYGSSSRASAVPLPQSTGVLGLVSAGLSPCLPPLEALLGASLPWVPWASLPHLPRYYATLRLPPVPLGLLRLSLASRYLACFPRSWSPRGLVAWAKRPGHARACGHPVPHSGYVVKETDGSPKFPSSPCEDMPRSQTPVVSCALAIAHPGLLPSSALHNRRLPTTIPISGLNHAACLLATPGSVRPLTRRHAGSLLTCWLDVSQVGLEPSGAHPLGNNNLIGFSPITKVSGLPWREHRHSRPGLTTGLQVSPAPLPLSLLVTSR